MPPRQVVGQGQVRVTPLSHRDPQLLDIDQSTLEAGWHYRWVRAAPDDRGRSVAKHRRKGYEVVKQESGVKTLVEPDNRPDKVIAIGDSILMRCPTTEFNRRQAERKQVTESRLQSAVAVTKQMAEEKGLAIIDESRSSRE